MAAVTAGYSTVDAIAGMFPTFRRPPAWRPDTSYDAGYTIRDANGNQQQAPLSGGPFTSGSGSEPVWNTTQGQFTSDGSAPNTFVWTNTGGLDVDQSVTDAQIVRYALDIQGDIDAVLQRRFNESISALLPPGLTAGTPAAAQAAFAAWLAQLQPDALDVLESTCRYGAAAELGETLATLGNSKADAFATRFRGVYNELLAELAGEDGKGQKRPQGGRYDNLFDPLAAHESVRPALSGIPGGNSPRASLWQEGLTGSRFGKFDRRGT